MSSFDDVRRVTPWQEMKIDPKSRAGFYPIERITEYGKTDTHILVPHDIYEALLKAAKAGKKVLYGDFNEGYGELDDIIIRLAKFGELPK